MSIRLDPTRIEFDREPPQQTGPLSGGPIGSLILHLLLLLTLVSWPRIPEEISTGAIPIQIAFEPASPVTPAGVALPTNPPLSSATATVDVGKAGTPKNEKSIDEALPTLGEPQLHAVQMRAPDEAPPPPLPEPEQPRQSAQDPVRPANVDTQTPEAALPLLSTRNDYLAYLVTLTRQHLDLLQLSTMGDRRGATVISVIVYDDGSIAHISIYRSSGYPDIDRQIQEMVAAVGKFPPIPQQYQGTAMELELTVRFPETWER